MTATLLRHLQTLDRRTSAALWAILLLFIALEAWLLVLRAPWTEWQTLSTRLKRAQVASITPALGPQIDEARRSVTLAETRLQQASLGRSDDDTVLHLISTLSDATQRHPVQLGEVRKGERREEHDMQVVSFTAEARGSYLDLVAWLSEVEPHIAPLQTTELHLRSSDEGRQVSMRVKLTAHQALPPKGPAP